MDLRRRVYLRIACANLRFGGLSRTGDLSPLFETLAVLSGWDVHIALLQEVSHGDEIRLKQHVRLIASELGMTLAASGSTGPMTYGPNRPAVFVRKPGRAEDRGLRSPRMTCFGRHPAAWAHARVGDPGSSDNELGPAQPPSAAKIRSGAGAAGRIDGESPSPSGETWRWRAVTSTASRLTVPFSPSSGSARWTLICGPPG